jgi:hypothetical protein
MNATSVRGRSLLAIATVIVGMLALTASAGAKTVVYNNIVEPLPGNFASEAFEATQTSEYGGELELAGSYRSHPKITVAMSAWGCQEGGVFTGETCQEPKPARKFKWPLTLNIYEVGPGGAVGAKLASETHTFSMPYRPPSSRTCTEAGDEGAWYDAAQPGSAAIEKCFHGIAFLVHFKPQLATPLPNDVIVSVAYNTSNYGEHPVGAAACQSTAAGCYYDSLNVALIEPAEGGATVGHDPTESQYINSEYSEEYCGDAADTKAFGPTPGTCWEGDQPAIQVEASKH